MLPTAPVLMLRGTRWSVNDPYNPANDVHFFGRRVTIGERNLDPSSIATHEAKTALSVWDASIALAKYLEVAPDLRADEWPAKRVIEVGAGCGLVGIALGLQGASVTITDLGEVLPSLQMNVDANKTEGHELDVKVAELRWGEDIGIVVRDGPFDLIVASDVIWLDHLLQPLVDTFTRLMTYQRNSGDGHHTSADDCQRRRREIILAHETRSLQVEQKFFRLMADAGFVVQQVSYDDMHPSYRAKDIAIYRIRLAHHEGTTVLSD